MYELREAAALLQKMGWTVTRIALECEDDGEHGMNPIGVLVMRHDPLKDRDTL